MSHPSLAIISQGRTHAPMTGLDVQVQADEYLGTVTGELANVWDDGGGARLFTTELSLPELPKGAPPELLTVVLRRLDSPQRFELHMLALVLAEGAPENRNENALDAPADPSAVGWRTGSLPLLNDGEASGSAIGMSSGGGGGGGMASGGGSKLVSQMDQAHGVLQRAASSSDGDPSSNPSSGSARPSAADSGAGGDAQRSFVAAVARAALQQQAHDAHESMMAWRAAETVRDVDGVAASIAAGQAEAAARRAAGGGGSGSGGWSTGGSSADHAGGGPSTRRSSLEDAAAVVKDQRRTHTARRRAYETNKKLAADEQALVEEEVRLFAEERRIQRQAASSAGRSGTLDASQSLSPHTHDLPSLRGSATAGTRVSGGGHSIIGSDRTGHAGSSWERALGTHIDAIVDSRLTTFEQRLRGVTNAACADLESRLAASALRGVPQGLERQQAARNGEGRLSSLMHDVRDGNG
ncbi:hypothetical protein WJX81_006209 [Elliptochloris bilobata]|uniref:C2 NT-type domain-containing protein n=1 Tax=Elliptochloris bilobata TaxID=381761 RepID=A0AAW1R367_9CHLO